MKRLILLTLCLALLGIPCLAQEAADEAPAEGTPALENVPLDTYTYDPRGRRDPFLSLLSGRRGFDLDECTEDTIECLLIEELDIQGIWKIREDYVVEVQATDNNVYWLKKGDTLRDGEVIDIDEKTVIFKQKVNDPTRIKPYREVVRSLFEEKSQGRSK